MEILIFKKNSKVSDYDNYVLQIFKHIFKRIPPLLFTTGAYSGGERLGARPPPPCLSES